ncbi:hypothetical protein ACLMJK_001872 [Lecanora helva]
MHISYLLQEIPLGDEVRGSVKEEKKLELQDLYESEARIRPLARDGNHWQYTSIDAAIEGATSLLLAGVDLPHSVDLELILNSPEGLKFLQGICCAFDISHIEDLSTQDLWVLACVTRTMPGCNARFLRELKRISLHAQRRLLQSFDLDQQVKEINTSPEEHRRRFILSLSVGGSRSMLGSLLAAGLDLGRLKNHYFMCAIMKGNVGTANALLDHGADIDLESVSQLARKLKHLMRREEKTEDLLTLLPRMLAAVSPLHGVPIAHSIFDGLVCALIYAINLSRPKTASREVKDRNHIYTQIIGLLLGAGLLRDGKLPRSTNEVATWKYGGWAGSALTLAVDLQNLDALKLLLKYGYDLEETDLSGHDTPIMAAIRLGLVNHVAALLASGADISRVTRDGWQVWEIAALYNTGEHPRIETPITKHYGGCCWPDPEIINEGHDSQILAIMHASLKRKRGIESSDVLVQQYDDAEGIVQTPIVPEFV